MGAVLALHLALDRPHLIEALCLINPATSYRSALVEAYLQMVRGSPLSLVAPLLPGLPEDLYRTLPAVTCQTSVCL